MLNNKGGRFKMGWQTWVIIGLLVLSYLQYTNAEKTNNFIKPVWGKVHDFLDKNNPLSGGSVTVSTVQCPDYEEPVCADGKTYKNSCEAAVAGKTEVTPGVC